MNVLEIFEKIDSLAPKYVDVWEDICNIESPSAYKEGVDAVGKYFTDIAKSFGFAVELLEQ